MLTNRAPRRDGGEEPTRAAGPDEDEPGTERIVGGPAARRAVPDRGPLPPPGPSPDHRGRRPRRGDLGWVLGLVALSFLITVLGVVRATSLSALDEATHLDYAWSIAQGELPYAGSVMAPEVLTEWSCRKTPQDDLPPCGGPQPPAEYPAGASNYNYSHPPTYYAVTAAVARVGESLPLGLTFTTAARLSGAAWLAAAVVGLYLVLRSWRVSPLISGSAAAVVAASPLVAHASSIVSNDAPGALSGVLALWVLSRVAVHGKLGWLLPTALAAFVVSVKVIHSVSMLAVAAVLLAMAVPALRRRDRVRARSLVVIALGLVSATALVHFGWSAYQATRAVPGWTSPIAGINTDPVVGSVWDEWLPTLLGGFGITESFYLQESVSSAALLAVGPLLAVLLTAAPFANVAAFSAVDARRLVGWGALVGCAAVPLLVQIQAYINSEDYFPIVSERYALSLLPMTVTALALVAHHRGWRAATVAVSGTAVAVLVLSFAGLL